MAIRRRWTCPDGVCSLCLAVPRRSVRVEWQERDRISNEQSVELPIGMTLSFSRLAEFNVRVRKEGQ
jgi:hypothetical protein